MKTSTDAVDEVLISADSASVSIESLRELMRYREVLLAFTIRYLRIKYSQTLIGVGWAVIQPLALAGTLAILLGRLGHVGSEGSPYLAFALVGMAPWAFFSAAVSTSLDSVVRDQGMLRKVYFPREILPLSTVAATVMDLLLSLVVTALVVLIQVRAITLSWLLIPLPLVVLVLLVVAVALVVSAANVLFRDVRYLVPFVLQLGLVASPIAYSASAISSRPLRFAYETLNPVAGVIDALRRILLHGTAPDWVSFAGSGIWTLVLLGLAYLFFRRFERQFADRV